MPHKLQQDTQFNLLLIAQMLQKHAQTIYIHIEDVKYIIVLVKQKKHLTFACLPSITATQELVVPKSIPITAPLIASEL